MAYHGIGAPPFHCNLRRPDDSFLGGGDGIVEELDSLLFMRANNYRSIGNLSGREGVGKLTQSAIKLIDKMSNQPNIAITGQRNIGKTDIAAKLSFGVREQFEDWSIFWIRAQSVQTLQDSYFNIEAELRGNPNSIIAENRHTLVFYLTWILKGPWLMVLDGLNAEGAAYLRMENLLPRSHQGTILITTTDPKCAKFLGPAEIIQVPDFISQLHKADRLFNPEEHKDLEQHLTTVLLARPGFVSEQIDNSQLNEVQKRLVKCNLIRRNRFIYAQKDSTGLTPDTGELQPLPQPVKIAEVRSTTSEKSTKGKQEKPLQSAIQNVNVSRPIGDWHTIASSNSTLSQVLVPLAIELPGPPKIKPRAQAFKCPCCCQLLPVHFSEGKSWK
jgi:hypothetical protein